MSNTARQGNNHCLEKKVQEAQWIMKFCNSLQVTATLGTVWGKNASYTTSSEKFFIGAKYNIAAKDENNDQPESKWDIY